MKEKKDRLAAALSYDPKRDRAPRVVAAGRNHMADLILKTAEKHDVPVYRDEELAASLVALGAGAEIPPELYEVVARVLVFVARIDRKMF